MRAGPLAPRSGERGSLMVGLMVGIAIMLILAAVAAQTWSDVVRREQEAEMIFRAEDLVRALRRYQKDQGKLPTELKELLEPGQRGQYFARRLWKDPLVKGGSWQLLYAGPSGGLVDPTMPGFDMSPQLGDSSPQVPAGGVGIPDVVKSDDGTAEMAGLPIAGVKTRCTDAPFRHYKDKSEYSQWIFSVFELETPSGPGAPGPPGGGAGGKAPRPGPDGQQPSFPPR